MARDRGAGTYASFGPKPSSGAGLEGIGKNRRADSRSARSGVSRSGGGRGTCGPIGARPDNDFFYESGLTDPNSSQ